MLSELVSETIDMVAEPHEYGPESKLSRVREAALLNFDLDHERLGQLDSAQICFLDHDEYDAESRDKNEERTERKQTSSRNICVIRKRAGSELAL